MLVFAVTYSQGEVFLGPFKPKVPRPKLVPLQIQIHIFCTGPRSVNHYWQANTQVSRF